MEFGPLTHDMKKQLILKNEIMLHCNPITFFSVDR